MKPMQLLTMDMGVAWRAGAPPEWRNSWTPQRVPLEGGEGTCVVLGDGPPLVLLPPLPGFKEAFAACAHLLARTHRVIVPDLRAHFAPGTPPVARWNVLVADAERLCDHLGLGEVAVAGHSLGGALAQHWALAHPGRVRALVLSSSFAHVTTPAGARASRFMEQPLVLLAERLLPGSPARALARRLARRYGWVYDPLCDDAVLELVRHAIRATPVAGAIDCVRLAYAHDTRGRLGGLRMSVRLLVGERDTAFARAAAGALRAELPGATLGVSPGAGHLHPLSRAGWFAEEVDRHVRGGAA